MKTISCLLLLTLATITNLFCQDGNPYAEFGYQGVVLDVPHQAFDRVTYTNPDTTKFCSKIIIDFKLHLIAFMDKTDKVLFTKNVASDALLRWLTTDPAHQYSSPYLGMGNNPVSGIDPNGSVYSPIANKETGEVMGTDSEGYTGLVIYMCPEDFKQGMDHAQVLSMVKNGTAEVFSPFLTDVSQTSLFRTLNEIIQGAVCPNGTKLEFWKNFIAFPSTDNGDQNARYDDVYSKNGKYFANFNFSNYEYTVENIKLTAIHEIWGHGMMGYDGGKSHYKVYFGQMDSYLWPKTTPNYKAHTVGNAWDFWFQSKGYVDMPVKYRNLYDKYSK